MVINPEEAEAMSMALAAGRRINAEVILATDPDADRISMAIRLRW